MSEPPLDSSNDIRQIYLDSWTGNWWEREDRAYSGALTTSTGKQILKYAVSTGS